MWNTLLVVFHSCHWRQTSLENYKSSLSLGIIIMPLREGITWLCSFFRLWAVCVQSASANNQRQLHWDGTPCMFKKWRRALKVKRISKQTNKTARESETWYLLKTGRTQFVWRWGITVFLALKKIFPYFIIHGSSSGSQFNLMYYSCSCQFCLLPWQYVTVRHTRDALLPKHIS